MIKYYYIVALLVGYLDSAEAIDLIQYDSNDIDDLSLIDLEIQKKINHRKKKALKKAKKEKKHALKN